MRKDFWRRVSQLKACSVPAANMCTLKMCELKNWIQMDKLWARPANISIYEFHIFFKSNNLSSFHFDKACVIFLKLSVKSLTSRFYKLSFKTFHKSIKVEAKEKIGSCKEEQFDKFRKTWLMKVLIVRFDTAAKWKERVVGMRAIVELDENASFAF